MTLWEQHTERWIGCTRCKLSEGRRKVCLARGKIPADLMLVGEAPGDSENAIGLPFMGPAGHLLDVIVQDSVGEHSWCITNLVGCYPVGAKKTDDHAPPKEAILACAPRLVETVEMVRPKLIVCVGALARDWLDPKRKPHVAVDPSIPRVDITHPAALLRMPLVNRGLATQRCVIQIQNAIEEYMS